MGNETASLSLRLWIVAAIAALVALPVATWYSLSGSTTEVEVVRNLSGPRFEPTIPLTPGAAVTQNIAPSNQGLDRRRTVLPLIRVGDDVDVCLSVDFATEGVVSHGLIAMQLDGSGGRTARAVLATEGIRDGVPYEVCFERVSDFFPLESVRIEGLELRSGPGVAPMSRDLPFMARAGGFGTLEHSGQVFDDVGLSFIIRARSERPVPAQTFLPFAWTPLALGLVLLAGRRPDSDHD